MNLKKFLAEKKHGGFKLQIGYFAELKHELMGCFPAIENDTGEVVITTDFELLKQVCATLPPRPFKIITQLLYFDELTGQAYSILGTDRAALAKATPFETLTRRRFDKLCQKEKPFK